MAPTWTKTGRLPASLHRALLEAFKERHEADYALSWHMDAQEVQERLTQAEEFVSRVREVLRQ